MLWHVTDEIGNESAQILFVDSSVKLELDGSVLNLFCEKDDTGPIAKNEDAVSSISDAIVDDIVSQPDIEQPLQLRTDNLPFELSTADKLFSDTFVSVERIDVPRSSAVSNKPVYLPVSSKYPVDRTSHVCSVCSMWFKNDVTLRRHIPLHVGAKPYTCNECRQSFRWSVGLKNHQMIYAEDSRLLCKSCGQQFESQCRLKLHSCRIEPAVPNIETETPSEDVDTSEPFFLEYASDIAQQYIRTQTYNPLQCRECGKMFRFAASRKQHEKLHTGEKPHMCTVCGKQFADISTLRNHRRVHSGVKPFRCDECGKSFLWPNRLESHKMLHAGINPHKCKNCGERFRFRKGLLDHKEHCLAVIADNDAQNETGIGVTELTVEEQCINDQMLILQTPVSGDASELNRLLPQQNVFSKLFKCHYCEKQFVYEEQLRKHEQVHNGEKPYRCQVCGKHFANPTCLKLHQRLHTGEKPHTCGECGMSFRWRGGLAAHLDVHAEVFPHACGSCGERFRSLNELKEHRMKFHPTGKSDSTLDLINGRKDMDEDGSCKCPICEKPFASRYYLKKHVILHTNELPFKCEECGKLFRWQASLKNHRMQEHGGPKPQMCKECGQGFKSLHSLKKHCLIDHGSAKIFTCNFCPKYFLSSYAQARHEVIHQKK